MIKELTYKVSPINKLPDKFGNNMSIGHDWAEDDDWTDAISWWEDKYKIKESEFLFRYGRIDNLNRLNKIIYNDEL